jgi:predicted DNA-binding protein YlxM (UPF0122 family)
VTPRTADLWSVFEHLTAHQKRVVFEMYQNGYSQEECAETMGIHQSSVSRTLAGAQRTYEKKLEAYRIKKQPRPFIQSETADEGAERGNGQRSNTSKAPVSNGPPASLCPQPDTYYETPDREAFIKELSWCAASPFLQLQNRGGYNERAKANRARIARDREAARIERLALQAA